MNTVYGLRESSLVTFQYNNTDALKIAVSFANMFTLVTSIPQDDPNSYPNGKNLDLIKLKAYADDTVDLTNKTISVFDRIEGIVGIGKYAGN